MGGHYKGECQIWKDWEMSRTGCMMWNSQGIGKKYVRKPLRKCTCGGYMNMYGGPQGSETLDPGQLELRRVVRFPVWALGTALGLAARATHDRNRWAVPQTPPSSCRKEGFFVLFWFWLSSHPPPQTFSEDLNLIRANKVKGIKIKMKMKLHGNGKLCRNVQRWHTTTSQSHGWREEEIHLEENRTAVLTNLIKNVRFIIRAQALIQCIVTF